MKLNSSKQRQLGVMLSYISLAVSTLLSLVYTPLLLDKLGQEEYGVYTLVASAVSYLTLLSLGFGSAYVRFYSRYAASKDRDGEYRLNGTYFLIYCVMGVLALVIGGVLAFNSGLVFKGLSDEEANLAKTLLLILVVNTAISFPLSVFDAIVTAHECFIFQKILIMIKRILTPCLVMVLLLLGYRSIALVVVNLLLTVVTGAASVYYVFAKIHTKFRFRGLQVWLLKEMSSYSFFIFIIMIADQISWNLDKLLLGVFQSSIQIAIYGVAAQLNSYYLTFSDVVSNVFTPKIHTMVAENKSKRDLTDLMTRVGRIQFYIAMLIFLGYLFFGQSFIRIWAGEEYGSSYVIGIVLLGSVTLPLIESISTEVLRALGLHKQYSLIVCATAVLNLLLSIPLSIWFGAMGCAIGTAVAMFVCSWVMRNIYLKRKAGIEIGRFFKELAKMLPSLVLPAIAGVVIMLFAPIHGYVSLLLYILLYVAVFFVSIWLFAMNNEEINLVRKLIHKYKGKEVKGNDNN